MAQESKSCVFCDIANGKKTDQALLHQVCWDFSEDGGTSFEDGKNGRTFIKDEDHVRRSIEGG